MEILFAVVCFAVVAGACVAYFVPFMVADIIKNWFANRWRRK